MSQAVRSVLVAASALALTGQAPPPDPFFHIVQPSRGVVACNGRPISLDGAHSSIQLTGYCPVVQVAGEHNDITVPIPPAGTIQIVAPHNDVTWFQTAPGPPPRLLLLAPSNTFHRR